MPRMLIDELSHRHGRGIVIYVFLLRVSTLPRGQACAAGLAKLFRQLSFTAAA